MPTAPSVFDDDANVVAKLRVPPHSLESESSLLGALLLNNDAHGLIVGVIKSSDFYRHEHKEIFKAIVALIDEDKAADVVTVFEHLQSWGKAEEVGGASYLNRLAQYVPSASNITRYAEIVQSKSILRRLIAVGDEVVRDAFGSEGKTPAEQLESAEAKILQIGSADGARPEDKMLSTLIPRFNALLLERSENPGQLVGVSTGFQDLDQMTNGLKKGNLIVVAGRPAMGKTSLAMNMAEHCALRDKLPVLVMSLEMSADELTTRLVGSVGRIDQMHLQTAQLADHEWGRVSEAMETLHSAPLEIQDAGVKTISEIRAMARRFQHRHKKIGMIIVDYLQLVSGGGEGAQENRATEVGHVSRGLKLLAGELQCPVIALSQLNRAVEDRPDKRPRMSDIRESGSVEQDADAIMFVYRDEFYSKESCLTPGVAEIIIAKQRNGPTGTVRLAWQPTYTRFANLGH
jgi:replicative DNA helicase